MDIGSYVIDEKRDYQRIVPSGETRQKLRDRGFTWVFSSNVSAVREYNGNLYIRFHNGSLYKYFGKADLLEPMLNSSSKGRYVWDELRRKNVPYEKVGQMSFKDDVDVSDEAIMQPLIPAEVIARIAVDETPLDQYIYIMQELRVI